MTGSSARPSSASEQPRAIGARDLHLWFSHRDDVADSDALRRAILSRYAPLAPADWRFSVGDHGKPDILNPPLPLSFNLSHSGDWFACAVSGGTPVGVDIEHTARRNDTGRLAKRFFTPPELAAIDALSPEARKDRFFDYWTLKEAAVKARGDALPPSLRRRVFALSFAAQGQPGEVSATYEDSPDTGAYFLFDAMPGYRLALCWLPGPTEPPAISVYRAGRGEAPALSLRAGPAG